MNKGGFLSRSNSLTIFSNRFFMIKNDRKKCREHDALFAVDQQRDEAASAKTASRPWLLSMFHRLTTVINITFSNFRVNLPKGMRVTVDCPFGIQYWLQPGTTCSLELHPACSAWGTTTRLDIPKYM